MSATPTSVTSLLDRYIMVHGRRRLFFVALAIVTCFILYFSATGYGPATLNLSNASGAGSKVAAIVENRPLENLIPVVLHFSAMLGAEWPIYIFTIAENVEKLQQSAVFERHLKSKHFHIKILPQGVELKTHSSVSDFFTQPWFWEQLLPANKVLMFQTDSIICSNSARTVDEYLEWDFIGAPLDPEKRVGAGYNGGLSIRNVKMMLDIVKTHDWREERTGEHIIANLDYEDQWFYTKMLGLPPKSNGEPGAHLPSLDQANEFSVEVRWAERPLGYHQAQVWQPEKMQEILEWCPEYSMAMIETFTDHS